MRLTTKTDYAVIMLTHLALTPDRAVSLQVIAQAAGVSEPYLQRIAALLKKAGLISAQHGAHGGYRLRQPADRITLHQVIESVGDRTAAVRCSENECPHKRCCPAHHGWLGFQLRLNELFAQTTIADMLEQ